MERCELQFLTLKKLLHDRLSVPESSGRKMVVNHTTRQIKTNRICVCYGSARASTRRITVFEYESNETDEVQALLY
jgi:hypothetical protein